MLTLQKNLASSAIGGAPKRPGLPVAGWLALLLLSGTSAGCSDDAYSTPIACAGNVVCPPPSPSISWAVQLWPDASNRDISADPHRQLTPQESAQLAFDPAGTAQLFFRAPAVITGTVSDSDGQPLTRARVVARLQSAITGQSPYSFDTLTADRPSGMFSLRVPVPQQPSEQPYRFWVGFDDAPQAGIYPPRWQERVVNADSDIPLRLRPATELATIYGHIFSPLGEGVGGMTVQVLDADNQIVSSTSVSASDKGQGSYRVLVDPTLPADPRANLKIVVRPGPQAITQLTLEATLPLPRVGTETKADFAVPSQRKTALFQLPIRGAGPSGANMPVVGARVQAQVALEDAATIKLGHRAIYTATADTDSQGMAKLTLVPAPTLGSNLTYKVTVQSPARSPFASLQSELQVGPSDGLLSTIAPPLRAQVSGRLLNANGEAVANAQVIAQPIPSSGPPRSPVDAMVADSNTPTQTTTDAEGRFALRLDGGDYDLDFVPISGTAPRASLDNRRVSTTNQDLGDLKLPRPTLGKFMVNGPTGSPAAQAKVRIFQQPDTSPRFGFACVQNLPCSRAAKLRAEGFTDSKGRMQLLLPESDAVQVMQPSQLH
jgi:hypothetical protein